jgi:hypothetical protein
MFLQEVYIVLEIADNDMKKLLRADVHLSEEHVKHLLYNLLVSYANTHDSIAWYSRF